MFLERSYTSLFGGKKMDKLLLIPTFLGAIAAIAFAVVKASNVMHFSEGSDLMKASARLSCVSFCVSARRLTATCPKRS